MGGFAAIGGPHPARLARSRWVRPGKSRRHVEGFGRLRRIARLLGRAPSATAQARRPGAEAGGKAFVNLTAPVYARGHGDRSRGSAARRKGAVMTAAAAAAPGEDAEAAPTKKGGKTKLIVLVALVLLLGGVGAGLWFGGILPPLLGMGPKPAQADATANAAAAGDGINGKAPGGKAKADAKPQPVFMELPEIIANLNAGPRRNSFIKLRPKIELARAEDEAVVRAAMPRLLDLFQTYLREMRPEELRGSAGTYRLREELLARANIAVAPARVVDLLFPEMIVQ